MKKLTKKLESFWQEQAELWRLNGKNGVPRQEIHLFTCGTIKPKSMANLDSLGLGPDSIRHGRGRIYPFETLVPWLEARTEIVEKRPGRRPR